MKKLSLISLVLFVVIGCSTAPVERKSSIRKDGDNFYRLGREFALQGRNSDALQSYDLAHNYYSRIDDLEGIISVNLATIGLYARDNRRTDYEQRLKEVRYLIEMFYPEFKNRLILLEAEIAFIQKKYLEVIRLTDEIELKSAEIAAQLHCYRLFAQIETGVDAKYTANRLRRYERQFQTKQRIKERANSELSAFLTYSLGYYCLKQGEYKNAEVFFSRSLETDKRIDNISGIARSLYFLGITSSEDEDKTKAKLYFTRAKRVFSFLGYEEQIKIIESKIEALNEMNR